MKKKPLTIEQKAKKLNINLTKNKQLKYSILEKLTVGKKIYTSKIKKDKKLLDKIFKYYNYETDNLISAINAIFKDYKKFPKCRLCGKPLKVISITVDFKPHCSTLCSNKDIEYHKELDKLKLHATEKTYKKECDKLIKEYERKYKKKFPKKLIEDFYEVQLKRVKENKSLITTLKYITMRHNCSTEAAIQSSIRNFKIASEKTKINPTEKQKRAWKENGHRNGSLPQTQKALRENTKKLFKWREEHPEECHRISSESGKKVGPLTIGIARESLKKKRERGEIEYYKSKEEINCRNELEKALNITFDYKINKKGEKVYNIYMALPKNCKKLYGNSHSYDFGIKKYKLLIEYDGVYWHHSKKYNTEKRDKYWDKKAKEKGFTVYRINSDEWSKKDKKLLIIEEIRNIIKQLKSSHKTNR